MRLRKPLPATGSRSACNLELSGNLLMSVPSEVLVFNSHRQQLGVFSPFTSGKQMLTNPTNFTTACLGCFYLTLRRPCLHGFPVAIMYRQLTDVTGTISGHYTDPDIVY